MRKAPVAALLVVGLFLFLHSPKPVAAYSRGVTGYSGNPATNSGLICNGCHGDSSVPTVTLAGPTDPVLAGDAVIFTLIVESAAVVTQTHAGLDVSATDGTLASLGPDTQVMNGEITQTGPKANDAGGVAMFQFEWTAPAGLTQPMTYTLYAAGNSVNLNHNQGGDKAAADLLTVTVMPACSPYDVLCDYSIDALDLAAVGNAWPCTGNDPTCYAPEPDVNGDGDIDIRDILEVAGRWGCNLGDACYA